MGYGFPQKQRLTNRGQYKRILDNKKRVSKEPITICFCTNELTYPRLGIGVSKKNINSASKRNYLKRIIREEFRLNQNTTRNIDLLVFVSSKAKEFSKKEIRTRLRQCMEEVFS